MMLLLATGLLSACTSAVPFCLGTWSLVFLLCLMGLNMGAMDNLSNIAMLKIYGAYSAPFLQVWPLAPNLQFLSIPRLTCGTHFCRWPRVLRVLYSVLLETDQSI